MKGGWVAFLGFLTACVGVVSAFLAIFGGGFAAVVNFGTKYLEIAGQINHQPRPYNNYQPPVQPRPYSYEPPQPRPYSYQPPTPPAVPSAGQPFQFVISDRLSTGQLSEQTKVSMGAPLVPVGQFDLTVSNPSGNLQITALTGSGNYNYTLESSVTVLGSGGAQRVSCRGQGIVFVQPKSVFSVELLTPVTSGNCIIGL
jgi:hypothetical protein